MAKDRFEGIREILDDMEQAEEQQDAETALANVYLVIQHTSEERNGETELFGPFKNERQAEIAVDDLEANGVMADFVITTPHEYLS